MSSAHRREAIEKERIAVFAKDIVTNNPIFSIEEIKVFFELFNFYADQRRQASMSDIIATASTLGFQKQHPVVYEAFSQVANQTEGTWIRFEQFLTRITQKLGNPKTDEGRRAMFELVDLDGKEKLTVGDLLRLSDNLGFNMTPDQIQTIVKNIAGPKERELTWAQFNEHIAKKNQKKSAF